MKIKLKPNFSKGRLLLLTASLGLVSLTLFTFFFFDIFRTRVIGFERVIRVLEQKKQRDNNDFGVTRVGFQHGYGDKGPDQRCLSWPSKFSSSGWNKDAKDHDFYIDYYVPAGKNAIICTTPALSTALAANTRTRFLYEVSKTDLDDGIYVRIVVGLSEVREPCKLVTGNVNCLNPILARQAVVKYEP